MAPENLFRNSQLSSNQSHFILEQLAQRLDQLQVHLLRQAAHIVMTLDDRRWTTHRDRLDHVRIQRALDQVADIAQTFRFLLEHVDENFPDPFPLLFRISHAFQRRQKQIAGANTGDVQLHALLQQRQRRFKLTLAQQSVIDENASLSIADRAMDQRRRHGRINSTRQARYYPAVSAELFANT